MENVVCVILYVTYSSDQTKAEDYFLILCILSIVPFLVGIFFMILYYVWFHPNRVSRRIYQEREMKSISTNVEQTSQPPSTAWIVNLTYINIQ